MSFISLLPPGHCLAGLIRGSSCWCGFTCIWHILMTPAVLLSEESIRHPGCHLGRFASTPAHLGGSGPWAAYWQFVLCVWRICHDFCRCSASDASDPDSSSLDTGRGMDKKLRVLTWGLPLRWLKAVLLYVMGKSWP